MTDSAAPPQTFRVIGVRLDGTRTPLGEGLTWERAEAVRKALVGTGAFREILIEAELRP